MGSMKKQRGRTGRKQPALTAAESGSDEEADPEAEEERQAEEEEKAEEEEQKKEGVALNFGKRLAHTDKAVRDKGFKVLKFWLIRHPVLERLEYLKLWKGLYFAYWMSDKRHVQQDLAVKLALLINDLPREKRIMWIDCFWEILVAEWEKLDVHRMSKYLLFLRIVVAEIFKVLREQGWQEDEVTDVAGIITQGVVQSNGGLSIRSVGVLFHYVWFFWDELMPQLEQEPKADHKTVMRLLEPFCVLTEVFMGSGLVKKILEMLAKTPAEFVPAVRRRLRQSLQKPFVSADNTRAICETARTLGALDIDPMAPPKKKKERQDFIGAEIRKRKGHTHKDEYCKAFFAKGRKLDEVKPTVPLQPDEYPDEDEPHMQSKLAPLLVAKGEAGEEPDPDPVRTDAKKTKRKYAMAGGQRKSLKRKAGVLVP